MQALDCQRLHEQSTINVNTPYAHGVDFASEGLELTQPMFILFDPPAIDRFEKRFSAAQSPLNFRHYSKALNPRLKTYGFEINKLLR